jgi:hypothetical protein
MTEDLSSFPGLGAACSDPGFAVRLGERVLTYRDFSLQSSAGVSGEIICAGECIAPDWAGKLKISWNFVPSSGGWRITLEFGSTVPLSPFSLDSLVIDFSPGGDLDLWRVPTLGLGVESVGMIRVNQLGEILGENPIQGAAGAPKYAQGSLLRGAFPNSQAAGLFLGTILPQQHQHLYRVERVDQSTLRFTASTYFIASYRPEPDQTGQYHYTSQTTWVSTALPILKALAAFAGQVPYLPQNQPPTGWNSWDYYFSAVTQEDILENADFIRAAPQLSKALQYIVTDMGWEHCWGEWQPNYRFPGGLEYLAQEIADRGFTPGIWIAPLIVYPLSYPGLRQGEMFIKNEFGDPWPSPEGGQYAVDPTHPAGQAFLREVFTRLYNAGFRLFKIDFVAALLAAPSFHDPSKGPYAVLADFFRLVRECVGPESHILGCSLPAECGPGLVDSRRTGIDIHNQWTHIEWAVDFYQFAYWQGDRIAVNDPDFLVVRGSETSLEAETNVLNPNAHNPNPPRWRRGEVFTLEEARTWAMFVSLAGGSVFLSDRPAMLNVTALELLYRVLQPTGISALPLDLGDNSHPALWFTELRTEARLGIINWQDHPVSFCFCFADWGIRPPESVADFWTGADVPVRDAKIRLNLAAHASAYLCWQRE